MKVLHVIPSLSPRDGGPTVALYLFGKALREQGIEVTVAATTGEKNRSVIEKEGVTYYFFPRNLPFYKISWSLRRWLFQHVAEFDLVHIHALFSFSSTVARYAAARRGVPYIIRPLGVLNQWGLINRRPFWKRLSLKLIELPALRAAACIHYTARKEREEAALAHRDIGSLASAIIPIPMDTGPLHARPEDDAPFRRKHAIPASTSVILFLSRIDEKKGIELLLDAFARYSGAPRPLLVIAGEGDGSYVEALRNRALSLKVENDVLWTGFLGGSDKTAAFQAATVFVLPSYSENFGIAAAEAMAAGLPTIVTDAVGIAEYITEYEAGLIVPRQAAALAEAMRRACEDREFAANCTKNGQRLIAEKFSGRVIGEQLRNLYSAVLAEQRRN